MCGEIGIVRITYVSLRVWQDAFYSISSYPSIQCEI